MGSIGFQELILILLVLVLNAVAVAVVVFVVMFATKKRKGGRAGRESNPDLPEGD